MSKANPDQIKTSIYLSHHIWGELKLHAFNERTTASEIINFVVEQFLKESTAALPVSIHRSHNRDEDRKGRSVYFQPELWTRLQDLAKMENFSIASLIENLLAIYLGLVPRVEQEPAGQAHAVHERGVEKRDPLRYITIGGNTYDLGENPIIIDANGQPVHDPQPYKTPPPERRPKEP